MLNKTILIGRLVKDPEIRSLADGKILATFTLAVNRKYEKNVADFLPIIAFSKTAEFSEKWLKKGMQVVVIGRIQVRKWETKEGENRYSTEIIAEELEFAEGKKQEDKQDNTEKGDWQPMRDALTDADLPF
jgi:single-strand DNA-binding protein